MRRALSAALLPAGVVLLMGLAVAPTPAYAAVCGVLGGQAFFCGLLLWCERRLEGLL